MCRNIKTLFNFDPPATPAELESAARQYVRKLSGYTKPSQVNEVAFETAIEEITRISEDLLNSLQTAAPPRNREEVLEKARMRNIQRFK